MAITPRPPTWTRTDVQTHRTHLAAGAAACHLGGVTVWRTIKAVSQLVTILALFYFGFTGMIDPWAAGGGLLLAYLGVEAVESLLIRAGERKLEQVIEDSVARGEDALVENDGETVEVTTTVERNTPEQQPDGGED